MYCLFKFTMKNVIIFMMLVSVFVEVAIAVLSSMSIII